MDDKNFKKLLYLFELVDGKKDEMLPVGAFPFEEFEKLTAKPEQFTYDIVNGIGMPPYHAKVAVTVRTRMIQYLVQEKGVQPKGITTIHSSYPTLYIKFMDYETMLMCMWQPVGATEPPKIDLFETGVHR